MWKCLYEKGVCDTTHWNGPKACMVFVFSIKYTVSIYTFFQCAELASAYYFLLCFREKSTYDIYLYRHSYVYVNESTFYVIRMRQ